MSAKICKKRPCLSHCVNSHMMVMGRVAGESNVSYMCSDLQRLCSNCPQAEELRMARTAAALPGPIIDATSL